MRPGSFPDFALSGSKTAPSPGLISAGYLAGMKLPAQILNYLLNLNGLWHHSHVTDLDALQASKGNLAGGNTWTGSQTLQATSSLSQTLRALVANPAAVIQKVFQFQTSALVDEIHLYTGLYTSQGVLFLTYNASWNGTQWSQLDATRPSACLYLDSGAWGTSYQAPGAGPWAAWAQDGTLISGILGGTSVLTTGLTSDGASTVYSPGLVVTETLPIASMCHLNAVPDATYPGSVAPSSSPSSAWLSLQIPNNVVPGNIQFFHHRQLNTYDTIFRVWRRNLSFATGGATPTLTAVAGATYAVATGAGAGDFAGGFNASLLTWDPTKEYLIEWVNGSLADVLYGISVVGSSQGGPRAGLR